MKKQKPYWEMNTAELAEATKEFDDPNYNPPAIKPTAAGREQLRVWHLKRNAARSRIALVLDKNTIAQTDSYAADHGIPFSEVVTIALHQLMRKKSA